MSGTHNSDTRNFVESAMSGTSGFTKVAVYYFYQQCEANSDIDTFFQPFLDPSMRGDTVSLLLDNDEGMEDSVTASSSMKSSSGRSRKRATQEHDLETEVMLQNVFQQGGEILKQLADAAEERKAAAVDLRKNRASMHVLKWRKPLTTEKSF